MRNLVLLALLALPLACSDSRKPIPVPQAPGGPTGGGGGGPGTPGGGGGGGGGSGGGGGTPPPVVGFDDAVFDLQVPAGFPSDLEVDGSKLYTVADATIPATVRSFQIGAAGLTPLGSVAIQASHLADMDGTNPARAPTTFGTGLFGAFTGDIEPAFGRWLFVTVGAGNSASDDGTNPLWLGNVVVIDMQTQAVVQTVNVAWALFRDSGMSTGNPVNVIPQSMPVMCAFVPSDHVSLAGKLYVAMTNGAGSSAGLAHFFPGTVQVWNVDFTRNAPVFLETAGKDARDVTRTFVSEHFNPVALTHYEAQNGLDYLILTDAGASLFDASFVLKPTTETYLEFLDLDTEQWREEWTVQMPFLLPSAHRIALAEDANGVRYGLVTSQTFAAVHTVELTGLESNPVDPTRLRLLRAIELTPGGLSTAGSGYQPSVVTSPDGAYAVVSSFTTAGLTVLKLPADAVFGDYVLDPPPFTTAVMGSTRSAGLGALAPFAGPGPEVYALVNGSFDMNFNPSRNSFLGALNTNGLLE